MREASFGESLRQFSLSVDIVDQRTKDDLHPIVRQYIEGLGVAYFEISLDGESLPGNQPALKTLWTNGQPYTWPIDGQQGYANFAYRSGKPLWITAKDAKPLRGSSHADCVDGWSHVKELPPFWDFADTHQIYTSIHIPLIPDYRPIGLLVLELARYQEPVEGAKKELKLIADALADVLSLERLCSRQSSNTRKAIQHLAPKARIEAPWLLAKPKMFFAFSGAAREDVVGVVKDVLRSFAGSIDVVAWDETATSGNINRQLLADISSSRYGICYLSQPKDDGTTYVDNPNVVFEAGMFQALVNTPDGAPEGWIPIREEQSDQTPFDFAAERTIVVRRGKDGKLNEQRLKTDVRRAVTELVSGRVAR